MKLNIEGISKSYKKFQALQDFTAELSEGIYGLIGPNGSGKSTLMRILTGNQAENSGKILWNGTDVKELGMKYLSVIGYMPQESALYPQLTIYEFLLYMAAVKGLDREEAKKQIAQLLEVVSLSDAAHKKISSLSGGMRQRTCLVQALLGDPKILILDEPTAGLDPTQRIAVRSMLAQFSADRIILIATHVISDIEGIANELLLISKGKLLKKISPMEMTGSVAGRVFELPVTHDRLQQTLKSYNIVSVNTANNKLSVRILADSPPENAVAVPPTLEDAYIDLFGSYDRPGV